MASYGPVILRFFSFDENTYSVGEAAVFTQSEASYGDPTAIYTSVYPLNEGILSVPFDYTDTATSINILNDDVPDGLEFIDVEFIPVVAGVSFPIDPLNPPPELTMVLSNYYAGGVVQIGAYSGGEFFAMGEQELTIDDNFGLYTLYLTALPVPQVASFWTGYVNTYELADTTIPLPPPPDVG